MESRRNLKTLNNKTGQKIKNEIASIIRTHDEYKKCYFWAVNMNAAQRRSNEFENKLQFKLNGHTYRIEQSLSISCRNFYFKTNVKIDDTKKDIRIIKKLLV